MKKAIIAFSVCLAPMFIHGQEKIFEYRLDNIFDIKNLSHSIHKNKESIFLHSLVLFKEKLSHSYYSTDGQKREIKVRATNINQEIPFQGDTTISSGIYSLYKKTNTVLHILYPKHVVDVLHKKSNTDYFIVSTDIKTGIPVITDTLRFPENNALIGCYE
ncbi:MAG: hypothetical protein ACXWCG_12765, partial [Flavitalea sp.]